MDASDGRDEPIGSDGEEGDRRGVILLVEDSESDRHLYGRLLWYNGYTLLHAGDGHSAIRIALESRPDLILLDVTLAGELSGLDVARRLRGEGLDMPIVGLSAHKRDELGPAVEEAGLSGYLEKPVDPFVVVREVLRHLGG